MLLLIWHIIPVVEIEQPLSLALYDSRGQLLGASIAADEQWRFPQPDSLPEKFTKAIVCFEDRRFFNHPGVDILAICRAATDNLLSHTIKSGGSTITMQVIRLSQPDKPRSILQKCKEALLALRLESAKNKNEILIQYASHAPFGGNVVGLEAASWRYFNRGPQQLSWAESAMLAVLPNNPSIIHPGKNRSALLNKRNRLLDKLLRYHHIDSLQCRLAKEEPLPPKPYAIPNMAPHLLQRAKKENSVKNISRALTTLDASLQNQTTQIINRYVNYLKSNSVHNAAAIILDVKSGGVLAYVGNASTENNNEHGQYVDIITSPRSTGSILKPLLYAAMLDAGEILPTTLVPDIPTRIGGFAPQNFDRVYAGAVPAQQALARSLNIPAVRMLHSYGIDRFYDVLKSLGMTTLFRPADDYGLSLILGGSEGTLWEITSIYAGLARNVNRYLNFSQEKSPVFKRAVYLSDNSSAQTITNQPGNPLGAGACWLALNAMREVGRPESQTGWRHFSSSSQIAWKTGTSFGFRDGWAVGINPKYAVGVWVGNADGEGRPGLTGISTAAPILFEIFGILPASTWFDMPEAELLSIKVCAESGYRAGPYCKNKKTVYGLENSVRTKCCPYCRLVRCTQNQQFRVHSECEHVYNMNIVSWFVLPPSIEWFYKQNHADYKPLPPFRSDCLAEAATNSNHAMSLIHHQGKSQIYVPLELDGKRGKTVFEISHRNPDVTLYWHLDDDYISQTTGIHQMALSPEPGEHVLTVVDENGERLEHKFLIY